MTKIVKFREKDDFLRTIVDFTHQEIALAYGHFTSIHPGHIRYLQNAKSFGRKLFIALRGDNDKPKSEKYIFSMKERSESLAMLKIADLLISLENDELDELVKILKPKVLILGTEYKNLLFNQVKKTINFAENNGIKVVYDSGENIYASTELLSESNLEIDSARKKLFIESCNKQNIDPTTLTEKLLSLRDTPMLIIGDSIVDEYAACEALGMSAEAPVLVVKELKTRTYAGGAAVVASHVNQLGGKCFFLSVTGNDNNSEFIEQELKEKSIETFLIRDESRPTTFKKRYMVENQKLFRVSKLEEQTINKDLENKLIDKIKKLIPKVKGIIISDFNYGVITKNILANVNELAKEYNVSVFADSQSSSQLGSITKFNEIALLCPNEREARIALQDKFSGLEFLANEIFDICSPDNLIMKLGNQGFITYSKDKSGRKYNQHFPALASNPVDQAGAGDSLLACMSLSISSGLNIMEASCLSCFMCMIAVQSIGNKPISYNELNLRIKKYLDN